MRFASLICGIAWGQSIMAPQMGVVVDSIGRARDVFGVSASVTLGDPIAGEVLTSACANGFCVLKTRSSVIAGGGSIPMPGAAFVAIDGAATLIYFPAAGALMRWQSASLTTVPLNIAGEIVGLRSTAGVAQFAVRGNGVTQIVDQDGGVVDSIPAASGPVLLASNAVIYCDGGDAVLRRADGSELRFPAPGATSFLAIEANYVEIRAGRVSYGLRIDAGHERIFQLPEPAP
jgi:hypothetical protein